jgi:hypothetical protein
VKRRGSWFVLRKPISHNILNCLFHIFIRVLFIVSSETRNKLWNQSTRVLYSGWGCKLIFDVSSLERTKKASDILHVPLSHSIFLDVN